jgi:hypothetical protein
VKHSKVKLFISMLLVIFAFVGVASAADSPSFGIYPYHVTTLLLGESATTPIYDSASFQSILFSIDVFGRENWLRSAH